MKQILIIVVIYRYVGNLKRLFQINNGLERDMFPRAMFSRKACDYLLNLCSKTRLLSLVLYLTSITTYVWSLKPASATVNCYKVKAMIHTSTEGEKRSTEGEKRDREKENKKEIIFTKAIVMINVWESKTHENV